MARFHVNGNGQASEAVEGTRKALDFLTHTGANAMKEYKDAIERAIKEGKAIREAEEKLGRPTNNQLVQRKEGILGRVNARDKAAEDAAIANWNRTVITAEHLAELERYAAFGKQSIMQCVEYMDRIDEDLPDHLKPLVQALTQISIKYLSTTYGESLELLAETGLREVVDGTKPDREQRGQ